MPSAVRGLPVVGFAVPFQTPTGKRVFSGAYPVEDTPIALFVRNAVPFHTANIVIVDSAGIIVASNDPAASGRPLTVANPLLAPIDAAPSYMGPATAPRYLPPRAIPGTPCPPLSPPTPLLAQASPHSGPVTPYSTPHRSRWMRVCLNCHQNAS